MNYMVTPHQSHEEIPSPELIPFGEVLGVSLSASTNGLTHGLHRYPAKYIPQIPRWAIREYSAPGDLVLDPFSGSGTTLVEALAEGRNCAGVDLDPLACLIAGAKTSTLNTARLASLLPTLLGMSRDRPIDLTVPLPGVKNFGHWFVQEAWADLQALRAAIGSIDLLPEERNFLIIIFSSLLRAVSNADDQSQKTYVSGTLRKIPPPVLPTFERKFVKALEGVEALSRRRSNSNCAIYNASATSIPLESRSVDLIVTSPPYLDSVDYMYNLMLEYFWLGRDLGVSSRSEYNARRRAYIGAKSPSRDMDIPDDIRDLITPEQVADYRRDALGPYFSSMSKHFDEAQRVLKDGGKYVLVIGNSRTQNGMLRLHDGLITLANGAGLNVEHAFGYRIRRHYMKFPRQGRGGIILVDWVITLRKGPPRKGVPTRLPLIDGQLSPGSVAH